MKLRVGISIRMVFLITVTAFLIFYLTISVIEYSYTNITYNEAESKSIEKAEQVAFAIKSILDTDFEKFELYSMLAVGTNDISLDERRKVLDGALEQLINDNPYYASVWDSRLLRYEDTLYSDSYGRTSRAFVRGLYGVEFVIDSLDILRSDFGPYIKRIDEDREEIISDPHWSINKRSGVERIQETTLSIPIVLDDVLIGVVGVDIVLDLFQSIVEKMVDNKNQQVILVSNDGNLVYHSDKRHIGEFIHDIDTLLYNRFDLYTALDSLGSDKFSIKDMEGEDSVYCSYVSFKISETSTPWAVILKTPMSESKSQIVSAVSQTFRIGGISVFVLSIIVFVFSRTIVKPVTRASYMLKQMALGRVNSVEVLKVNTKDELERMATSINTLASRLKNITGFAEQIGKGKFDMDFSVAGDSDTLGNSMIDMRNSLKQAKEDEKIRDEEKKQLNWASEGVNLFNKILRVDNQNIYALAYDIARNATDYTGALMGGLYIQSDSDPELYELAGSVGFGKGKFENTSVRINEGEVGRCIVEKETIFMDDIPESYFKVSSGLGKSVPVSLMIVPLIHNDIVVGVLELESLKKFERYQIEFIEKMSETIASTFASVKNNVRTADLLTKSQKQAEELEQQEEEMRQNMEEMQATQEETQKQEDELNALIDGFGQLLLLAEYDLNQKLLNVNDNYTEIYKTQQSQLIGKQHNADKFMNEEEKENHKIFWKKVLSGEVQETESYVKSGKNDYWVLERFIPVKGEGNTIKKIISVGFDITDQKRIEAKINQINEGNYSVDEYGEVADNEPYVDLDIKLEIIDLTYLKMVYKKDPKKIYNILKLYSDTLPAQVVELKEIVEEKDYKKLKSRINSLKTKMSYLGLKGIYEDLREIEHLLTEDRNLSEIPKMLDKTFDGWGKASKELGKILGIS